ncbi:MAG TPA: SDR family oxidoreductase [Fimbriimonadaceae bacterium]|nr:SDR family oxidoreductase [Fimbriimonadaceae bacterium]
MDPMKVLVMGGSGMLGHTLAETLGPDFDTFTTVRGESTGPDVIGGVDATDAGSVERALRDVRPDAVVNCVGVVKQSPAANCPKTCIEVNALFPHQLYEQCNEVGSRLIHISTDCVFDGARGGYTESDRTNATDLYGRTKALGEVKGPGALTLRTSIIGRETRTQHGLVEWFLANRGGTVKGYRNARFSGLTTIELSRVIAMLIKDRPDLYGLYNVAAEPIDKCALLTLLNEAFRAEVSILPEDEVFVDRTLDSAKFRNETRFVAPTWAEMVGELAATAVDDGERSKICC